MPASQKKDQRRVGTGVWDVPLSPVGRVEGEFTKCANREHPIFKGSFGNGTFVEVECKKCRFPNTILKP